MSNRKYLRGLAARKRKGLQPHMKKFIHMQSWIKEASKNKTNYMKGEADAKRKSEEEEANVDTGEGPGRAGGNKEGAQSNES